IDVKLNRYALCGICETKKSINKLSNLLSKLINRSDLTARITSLSKELLLETLKIIENCTSCEGNMRQYSYYSEIYKSIKEIENHLVGLEKGEKKEQGKEDIIYKLSDELIKIDVKLSRYALCEVCGGKKS